MIGETSPIKKPRPGMLTDNNYSTLNYQNILHPPPFIPISLPPSHWVFPIMGPKHGVLKPLALSGPCGGTEQCSGIRRFSRSNVPEAIIMPHPRSACWGCHHGLADGAAALQISWISGSFQWTFGNSTGCMAFAISSRVITEAAVRPRRTVEKKVGPVRGKKLCWDPNRRVQTCEA